MSAASINSVGLFLDILGVILLFRFALPSRVIEGPPVLSFGEGPDSTKQREKQQKWSKFWSWLGLVLLILGFVLQIVSNHSLLSGYVDNLLS